MRIMGKLKRKPLLMSSVLAKRPGRLPHPIRYIGFVGALTGKARVGLGVAPFIQIIGKDPSKSLRFIESANWLLLK